MTRENFTGIVRLPTFLAKGMVRFYQLAISPWLGRRCRHEPTCSSYALGALEKYGFWKGIYLSCRRLLRCHPWGSDGYDPVP